MNEPGMSGEGDTLRDFLARGDHPCPACGYNLAGLSADRCPECSQRLALTLSLAEPPVVAFALAVLGLAAIGAAAGMLVLAVVVISVLERDFPEGDAALALFLFPAVFLIADAVAVALLLSARGRRWFRTRSSRGRKLVAVACWGVSVAGVALWIMILMRLM